MIDRGDIEAAFYAAFRQCESAGQPLDELQIQILLQLAETLITTLALPRRNPLAELAPEQRQAFLLYVAECQQSAIDWKAQLLNDWLHNRDSGEVQFIRDDYGLQWLNQITATDISAYTDAGVKVKVGDRLEVANSLWEWVPQNAVASYEWYAGTVVRVFETRDGDRTYFNCTVRLENGLEYDINGMYDWNRPNWRWPQQSS